MSSRVAVSAMEESSAGHRAQWAGALGRLLCIGGLPVETRMRGTSSSEKRAPDKGNSQRNTSREEHSIPVLLAE